VTGARGGVLETIKYVFLSGIVVLYLTFPLQKIEKCSIQTNYFVAHPRGYEEHPRMLINDYDPWSNCQDVD